MNRRERLVAYLIDHIHRPFCRMERAISQSRLGGALHERASGLVHRSDRVLIGLVLLSGAWSFLPVGVAGAIVQVVLSLLVIAGLLLSLQHGVRLCERCVTEFAIDAPEHAARHRRRFRLFHRPVAIGLLAAPMFALPFLEAPWRGFAMLPSIAVQVLFALLVRFHSTYQPWCPYCHPRRGGGGGETEPAPDPSGGHGRPLPVV